MVGLTKTMINNARHLLVA